MITAYDSTSNVWIAEQRVGRVLCVAEAETRQSAMDGCADLIWHRSAEEIAQRARARARTERTAS